MYLFGLQTSFFNVGKHEIDFCTYSLIVKAFLITFQKTNDFNKQTYFASLSTYPFLDVICICIAFFVFRLLLERKPISSVSLSFGSYRICKQLYFPAFFCKKEIVCVVHFCICNYVFCGNTTVLLCICAMWLYSF